jgi:hypothetical protein
VCNYFYVEAVNIELPGTVCRRECKGTVSWLLLLLMGLLHESVEFRGTVIVAPSYPTDSGFRNAVRTLAILTEVFVYLS